jgi:DNA-binding GntR family transcriptional regulator
VTLRRLPVPPPSDRVLTLKQHAYQVIRQRLECGALPAGCRLSDEALAREIGISRSPVREAISQLVSEGLLEYRPRCGAFVKVPCRQEMEELYEIRVALESFAASKAALLATAEQLAKLERLHQAVVATLEQCQGRSQGVADQALTEAFLQADLQLHLHILGMSGNRRLYSMVEDCKILIRVFAHVPVAHDVGLIADAVQQHAAVVAAIRRHDTDAARDLMAAHIAAASRLVLHACNAQSIPSR